MTDRETVGLFEWRPSRQLIRAIRSYQRSSWLGRKIAVARHRFWSVVSGSDIPINTQIGPGLLMPHPTGVVIHPLAKVGANCLIHQNVTLGFRGSGQISCTD